MTRRACILSVLLLGVCPLYSQTSKQRAQGETWYEQALRRLNPDNIDYGSIWEQRKQAFTGQLGNPYFQFGVGATAAVVLLLTVTCLQRANYRRALDSAAQSIADALRQDKHSRQAAHEAILRYNSHIETCNRVIEARQEDLSKSVAANESELQRTRKELEDTRVENRGLRNELAQKPKVVSGTPHRQGVEPPAAETQEIPEAQLAYVRSLEKQLRDERRKNQSLKRTSVDDHRA